MASLTILIVASWVFVYVQTTVSPGSRPMVATPVAVTVLVSAPPPVQTRSVMAQPVTGRVSVTVLSPVASAPVKVKVRSVGSVLSAPVTPPSSSRLKPAPKVPPPVPVVV